MREPKNISVPFGTGWLAPKEGQSEDGIWQGRIYDLKWCVKNGVARIQEARVAFRKIKPIKFLGRFTVTTCKVDNILIFPRDSDNRLLAEHVQEWIISRALDRHCVHVEGCFVEWVLEPATARIADFHSEIEEQRRPRSNDLRVVA